ncbi:secretory subunit [Modicella reniformis]|uniref:Secretory subunit n=1 Tax=Modicella reniformis TaxID=1440133 RepID=A0A9P6SN76_9FUNG|nr:secretory subunit [Modicella reniformis]KAF9984234.1 secretory subunit [Modicella reniformis]
MAKYTFDENGDTFNFFVLTTLTIILVPATYLAIFKRTVVAVRKHSCSCDACKRKASRAAPRKSSGSGKKAIAILLGWVLFGFVAYQAYITPTPEVNRWNPFDILGIADSASPKQIKSAYRSLSKIWHPDKVKANVREEADSKMAEINKAYETLTDDETRENWEKYGHPDGSRSSMTMSIALPPWLVEAHNNFWVLSAYGIVCGLMLPYFIGKWWYRSGNFTKDRIRTKTMGVFFKKLKETSNPKEIVEILSLAEEFKVDIVSRPSDEAALEKLAVQVGTALESRNGEKFEYTKKTNSPASLKVLTLLYAHTLNVPVENKDLAQDQTDITAMTLRLINGMTLITTGRQWLSVSLSLMDMSQILVQGLYFHDSPLQQLPFVNADAIKALKGKSQIKSINRFMDMDREDRVALLKGNLTDDQIDQVAVVGKQYPGLKILKAFFKVAGDNIITPGSLCTFILKVGAVSPGEVIEDEKPAKNDADALFEGEADSEEDEDGMVKPKKESTATAPPVHAPYFPGDKKPFWWIVLGDHTNNRIVVSPTKVTDITSSPKTIRIQFQSPPRPGEYTFNLFIKSDSILGSDVVQEMHLKVLDASELPPEPEIDDDISEPDEDSIAGQMALLKEQGLAAAAIGGGTKNAPPNPKGKGKAKAAETDSETDSDSD